MQSAPAPVTFTDRATGPTRYTLVESPIDDLLLVGDGESITGLYTTPSHRHFTGVGADWVTDTGGPFPEARRQLAAYFAGELRDFDLPLAPTGTPFQRTVWTALTTITWGHTTTYGGLAHQLGRPTASRAVGMANGRNPISIIVPCHRVIGTNGSLIGYGGGLPRKQHLLTLEGTSLM
ncbi:methylated-DNA--[protein]-cysteine S-methyltransferase [Actinokineospora auranticolor]|uniref:Methylated-DNA--protein-cysteine methyltransferase n=1 Tax=Actinokineospora auranticolor TaxID=155976 RepID=A0A2S6GEF9_9PSEU|nr:methylated-DNA--[protein]-cysteine S-methyltransferase [Actinokineospora auranticolor]PPK63619.1 methylated-DNA-[protein]-cysteine S-methyltransferase [Actinokineospora auranticolor]